MIAQHMNKDIANAFGQSIGKMADEMGVSGWYATGYEHPPQRIRRT